MNNELVKGIIQAVTRRTALKIFGLADLAPVRRGPPVKVRPHLDKIQ